MEFVEQARAENRVAARREHQDKVEEYICQTEDIFNVWMKDMQKNVATCVANSSMARRSN